MKRLRILLRLVPSPLDTMLAAGVAAFSVGVAMVFLPAGLIALGVLLVAGALRLGGGR